MTDREDLDPPSGRHWSKRRVALFLVPLFLFYAYPLDFGSNDSLHAFLTIALYERGAIDVEPEVADFFINQDLAVKADGIYSNKPPGPAVWLLPAALLVDLFTPGKLELQSLLYFGRLLMLGVPFVLFLFGLGRALETMLRPTAAWGLVLAYALGTNASAYASLYFTHNLAATGLGAAFLILWFERRRLYWLAGLACAFAVTCELTTAGIAVVLAIVPLFRRAGHLDWRGALGLWGAALPIAVLLFLYNTAAFGSALNVGHQVEFENLAMSASFYGFDGPSVERAIALTVRPALGLFFHAPWLLLAIPGVVVACRGERAHRRMVIVAAACFAALFLAVCSHRYWTGGAVAGPRYLTAGLPFLVFAAAAALAEGRARSACGGALAILAVAGAAWNFAIVSTTPFIPVETAHLDENGVRALSWPLLQAGVSRFTAAAALGAGHVASLVGFVVLFGAVLAGYGIAIGRGINARFSGLALGAGLLLFGLMTQLGTTSKERARDLEALTRDAPFRLKRFHERRRAAAVEPQRQTVDVKRMHPGLDRFVSPTPEVTRIAVGLGVPVSPVWRAGEGLFFSDVYKNVIFRYARPQELVVHRYRSGYDGTDVAHHLSAGSSALAFDRGGGLLIAEQGNRRLTRLDAQGTLTTVTDRFEGQRLNGPCAIAIANDGTIYVADSPVGLRHGPNDPARGIATDGVYKLRDGRLSIVERTPQPNGLALSPDGRWLYLTTFDSRRKIVMRYGLTPEGDVRSRQPFADLGNAPFPDPIWGVTVGASGTLYVPGPGGVWLIAANGDPLGVLLIPGATGVAWGDTDGKTLFVTAPNTLYAVRMRTADGRR